MKCFKLLKDAVIHFLIKHVSSVLIVIICFKFSDIYFDMAERAYCWGFACIYPYSEDRRRQNSYNKCMNRLNANLGK